MRKNAIYILILSLVLFGCQQKPLHPTLLKAEKLMQSQPDSALAILGHYTTHSFSDSADIAAYALLRTQADDKNYIDHTSDSLIKIAVRYYDRHGSKLQQAQAHYYWGRVFQDRGDDVHTAEQYINATPLAQKSKNDTLIYLIKGNLAYLYWHNEMFKEATSIYKELAERYRSLHDNTRLAAIYLNLGEIGLNSNRNFSETSHYLLEAISLAKASNTNIVKDSYSTLSYLCESHNKWQQAIYYAQKGISMASDNIDKARFNLVIGHVYIELKRYNDARLYFKNSLYSRNPVILYEAYRGLSSIMQKQGNIKQAMIYLNKSMDYSSRIIDINQQTATVKMIKSKLAEEQLKQYKSENSSQKIIISFVLLVAIGSYIFYRRQKQTTLLKNLKNDDELELRRKKFEVSDIYMKFHQNNISLSNQDFALLMHNINNAYPKFTKRLRDILPTIREEELHLCCLEKIGLSPKEMEKALPLSKSGIHMARERLAKKILGGEAKAKDLHEFIIGL